MPKLERVREPVSGPLSPEYVEQRAAAGWMLVAVEWAREVEGDGKEQSWLREEVPYGLKVADDCLHLEENPVEKQALMLMMQLIVEDHRLSQVAQELNRQGFRTRQGTNWGPESVFNMLPRLIEVGPKMFSSREWLMRRQRVLNLVS